MPTHLLSRRSHKPRPALAVLEGIALAHGRLHEACGPARHSFALWLAAAAQGPVLWLSPARGGTALNPDGLAEYTSPARFLFVQAARAKDQLWAMEEALRSGTAALVVAELNEPPAMTPVRRLHLAAAAGGSSGPAPLGLLLTPGAGGAQGVESRWHLAPAHAMPCGPPANGGAAGTRKCWTLQRLRARTLPPRLWQITQAGTGSPLTAFPAQAKTRGTSQLRHKFSGIQTRPQEAPAAATRQHARK